MRIVILLSLIFGCVTSGAQAQGPLPIGKRTTVTIETPAAGTPIFKEEFEVKLAPRDRLRLKATSVGKVGIFAHVFTPGGRAVGHGNAKGFGSYDWTSEPVGVSGQYRVQLWAQDKVDIDLLATVISPDSEPDSQPPGLDELREQVRKLEQRVEDLERRLREAERRR